MEASIHLKRLVSDVTHITYHIVLTRSVTWTHLTLREPEKCILALILATALLQKERVCLGGGPVISTTGITALCRQL